MNDSHIHSYFSFDSRTSIESYIDFADKNNFKAICFTEHDEILDSQDLFEKYLKHINKCSNRTHIEILAGIELDIMNISKINLNIYNSLDFILLSYHQSCRTPIEYYANLYNLLLNCEIFSFFDSLAHIDFPLRYSNFSSLFEDQFENESFYYIEKILIFLIENNKALEINTENFLTANKNISIKFWNKVIDFYKKNNGKLLTYGSDSHNMDDFINSILNRNSILLNLRLTDSDLISYKNHKIYHF